MGDKNQPTNGDPRLVSHDFTASNEAPAPPWASPVGAITCHAGTPNYGQVTVVLEPTVEVHPGELLAVWHGARGKRLLTVVQVVDCQEINPSESPELQTARNALGLSSNYGAEGSSTRIFRVAECDTVDEYTLADGEELQILASSAPETLTRAGDVVIKAPDEIRYQALGILKDKSAGVHIGDLYDREPLPVTIAPASFQLHTLVTGNPGRGKSYLAGVLLEEAKSWDVPTLVVDLHGEFAPAAQELGGKVIRLPDPEQFGLTLDLLTSAELVHIAPNVQQGTQYAELIEIAHERLKGRDGPMEFDHLIEEIQRAGEALKTGNSSIGAAKKRIRELSRDKLMARRFDFIEEIKEHRLVVLDCRFVSIRQVQLIAAAAARTLQRYGRNQAMKAERGDEEASKWFALLFLDEAHMVAPNDGKTVSSQVLRELARMGRHARTGMVVASQSPADLDTSLLKRMQTRYIFALEKDQLRSISGVTTDLSDDLLATLPKLPVGTCAVSGSKDVVGHGFLIKVRQRQTAVRGGTPPIFGTRTKKMPIQEADNG